MPTTRKQKKARKSRRQEMLSEIENLDIMLGENHFDTIEREESLNSNLSRRPEKADSNNFENDDENTYLNSGVINPGINANYGRNSVSAENKRLSSELNSRISREMDEMMNSVRVQIQRAINDAIFNQVSPQIENVIMAGSGY